MIDPFTVCVNFILQEEGGYVFDKDDPGGETNFGISKRSYPSLDIKNLKKDQAIEIYKRDYWEPAKCEDLSFELAACVFDTSVNMGLGAAKQLLNGCEGSWVRFLQLRAVRYDQLIDKNPKLAKFRNGWLNRLASLKKFILINL